MILKILNQMKSLSKWQRKIPIDRVKCWENAASIRGEMEVDRDDGGVSVSWLPVVIFVVVERTQGSRNTFGLKITLFPVSCLLH